VLTEQLEKARVGAHAPKAEYLDRVGEVSVRLAWTRLLLGEGQRDAARQALRDLTKDIEALRAEEPEDLTPIHYLSNAYRLLATVGNASERREALRSSARAWHSWPATSFTTREEQRDLLAADSVQQ
jgi:hypothetical protein